MVTTTYKDDNGEDYDTWAARKAAEAAAHQRERGLEARLAALERRMNRRYSEVVEAMTLSFGDLRGEMDERVTKERVVIEAEAQKLEDLRETHAVKVERQVKAAVKAATTALARENQDLRNRLALIERRIKDLEAHSMK